MSSGVGMMARHHIVTHGASRRWLEVVLPGMAERITDRGDRGGMMRLSVSEAARLFGLSAQTIRRAIREQEIRYVVVRGRYRIAFESVLEWSQKHTTTRNKLQRQGIGQYVDRWRIRNKLYSPNPTMLDRKQPS